MNNSDIACAMPIFFEKNSGMALAEYYKMLKNPRNSIKLHTIERC
jgi:hypothetical protein